MATATMTMATMEANASGVAVSGEIRRDGTRYVAVVDGQAVGSGGTLRSALEAMANGIRRQLPSGRPDSWGVRVRCNTNVFGVAYGNLSGGGAAAEASWTHVSPMLWRSTARTPSRTHLSTASRHWPAAAADANRR